MRLLDRLSLDQINRRIEALRDISAHTKVRQGWIRYMRESMGMTLKNLGAKAGLSISAIQQAERNELAGTITLNRLKQMAETMDCELVYAFVPKSPITKILENAAKNKALRLLKVADIHMNLENQKVDRALKARVDQLAKTLLEKGDIW